MTDKYSLSRRKTLAGLATIGAAGAGAGLGTTALFSDTESFTNNQFVAGELNLRASLDIVDVNSTATPSVLVGSANSVAVPADNVADNNPFDEGKTGLVPNDNGQATAVVADGAPQVGVQLNDVKPGDSFILCVGVYIEGNPGYVRVVATSASDGNDTNQPESEPDPDKPGEEYGNPDGGFSKPKNQKDSDGDGDRTDGDDDGIPGTGELDNVAEVTVGQGYDAGNNSITKVDTSISGTLNQFLNDLTDGQGITFGGSAGVPGEISPGTPTFVYVKFSIPDSAGNVIQGDSVSFDLQFQAVQVRNNPASSAFGNNSPF